MIDAKTAKELANGSIKKKNENILKEIEDAIINAANKGEFHISYDNYVTKEVLEILEINGYQVSMKNFRNEPATYIEWK